MNNSEYTLDFKIPRGETGPIGPKGIQGVTGPTGPASLNALAYLQYNNTQNPNDLIIVKNDILPTQSTIFKVDTTKNELQINETGNYEFTITGAMKNFIQGERAGIYVQIYDEQYKLIYRQAVTIDAVVNESYFSRTFIYSFNKKYIVKVVYTKDNPSTDSFCENIALIVKRLCFGE